MVALSAICLSSGWALWRRAHRGRDGDDDLGDAVLAVIIIAASLFYSLAAMCDALGWTVDFQRRIWCVWAISAPKDDHAELYRTTCDQ